jgi:hypothetical protein
MKKFRTDFQSFGHVEVLTRDQLKKIMGGVADVKATCKSTCTGVTVLGGGTTGSCSQTGPVGGLPGACVCNASGSGQSSCYN